MGRAEWSSGDRDDDVAGPPRVPHPELGSTDDLALVTIFRTAQRLLRERGWCQGRSSDRAGRLSLEEALDRAVRVFVPRPRDRVVLGARSRNHLCRYAGAGSLGAWNDHPQRRAAEIDELLRVGEFLHSE